MNISKLGFYCWRHSLRKLSEYPFYECSNINDVRELTRQKLKNENITTWLDKLLNRKEGYHNELSKKPNTSDAARQLDYISKIFISTVIKNDVGLRGGLSPIFDETHFNAPATPIDINLKVPSNAFFVNTDKTDFSPLPLIDLRKNRDDYIIPYSTDLHRIDLNNKLLDEIGSNAVRIIKNIIKLKEISTDCAFVAIDFFVSNDSVTPFECHCPGRGIGLHLLPFLFEKKTSHMTYKVISDLKNELINYYGDEFALDIRTSGKTTFHELDRKLVSLLSCDNSTNKKTISLDVRSNATKFKFRDVELCTKTNEIIIDRQLHNANLSKIKTQLGNWVILKTRANTPWWSPNRKKPEILITDDKLIQRANIIMQKHGEIIMQKLVTDSVDVQGHFGELRVYYFINR